jgi:hypothetical protein
MLALGLAEALRMVGSEHERDRLFLVLDDLAQKLNQTGRIFSPTQLA